MERAAIYSIWAFIFTVPWENAVVFAQVGTIGRFVGLFSFALGLFTAIMRRKFRPIVIELGVLCMFLVWVFATCVWSIQPEDSYTRASSYAQMILMVWLVWQWSYRIKDVKLYMSAYVLGSYVSAFSVFYNFFKGNEAVWQRYSASGFDPNELGVILALAVPMAWYLSLEAESRWQVFMYRLYPLFAVLALVLTASRGAMAAAFISMMFIFLSLKSVSKKAVFISVAVVLLTGLLVSSYIPASSFTRLASAGTEVVSGDLNERKTIWTHGLQLFLERPLMGYGVGTFPIAVHPLFGQAMVAHNLFLSIIVEQGLIGFSLFSLSYILLALKFPLFPKLERRLYCILFLTWSVGVLTLTWDCRKPTYLLFGLGLAHCYATKRKIEAVP